MAKNCICGIELEDADAIYCGKKSCSFMFEEKVTDDCITNLYKQNFDLLYFHLDCALLALFSQDAQFIYTPLPPHIIKDETRFEMKNTTINIKEEQLQQVRILLHKKSSALLLCNVIKKYNNDYELFEKEGKDLYSWLKFTAFSSICNFKTEKLLLKNTDDILHKNNIQLLECENEWKISSEHSMVVYHGSKDFNWYSILRNGLKIMSSTQYMKNGAAYGAGIYTSSSLAYATSYGSWIAICIIDKRFIKKNNTTHIYVVQNESAIQIKAFIKIKPEINTNLHSFENLFKEKYMPVEQLSLSYTNSGPKIKRINKEFKLLQKEEGIEVPFDEENFLKKWIIHIKDKINLKNIGGSMTIEYHFVNDYPFSPPFVRMVSPRLEPLTGHITRGGAFCMEDLTNQGWSPSKNAFSVIQTIKELIKVGDGKLHSTNKTPYTFDEAKASFERIKIQHGWK